MMDLLHVKRCLFVLLTAAAIAASAHAETFPNRTMRIIVPYAPGGSIDLTARVIAKNLQEAVGQSVIVENKPGANAAIGIEDLIRSDPDGHTLIILSDSPVTINVHLSRVNYDPLTDLVPIGKVVSSPLILTANAHAGIASIAFLVKWNSSVLLFIIAPCLFPACRFGHTLVVRPTTCPFLSYPCHTMSV